jgi:hypothetical protein
MTDSPEIQPLPVMNDKTGGAWLSGYGDGFNHRDLNEPEQSSSSTCRAVQWSFAPSRTDFLTLIGSLSYWQREAHAQAETPTVVDGCEVHA